VGGGTATLYLKEAIAVAGRPEADLLAVDSALTALAELDPRKSQVVELRFFGGLSHQETAEVLKISEPTVRREWKVAKAWLRIELSREQSRGA
jgi:RNA polymerase sigma factor (sigma-70 family)